MINIHENIEVHPLTVRGQVYQVRLSPQGTFSTEHGSRTISADSRDGLNRKLLELTKKASVQVSVPITLLPTNRGPGRRAFIRGRHAGNGNVLILDQETGRTEQWAHPSNLATCREMTRDELERAYQLRNASLEANRAWNDFLDQVRIDLSRTADEAIGEAVAASDD